MASPPNVSSPLALSPPATSPAQPPSKKRTSTMDAGAPPNKRRKASVTSAGPIHPLRQTSFPPEGRSPMARSPSVDATSHVSGSAVSGVNSTTGPPKKKRGRKSKNAKGDESAERTPSLVGGKAGTTVSGQGGEKEGEDDDDDDKAEMAVEDVGDRTQEEKQEEIRLRAMLVEAFDSEQYDRYELWRASKLSDAVVKRVVNATVSQSVPQMVSTAVKAVTKLFAGEIIEAARMVQAENIQGGEEQADMPTPPRYPEDVVLGETQLEPNVEAESAEIVFKNEEDGEEAQPKTKTKLRDPDNVRGPLRPDHLREAWRRYRFTGESHGVGMQQLWHMQQGDGVERFSTKTGRRLFK